MGIIGDAEPSIGLVHHLIGVEASDGRGDFYVNLHLGLRLDRDGLFLRAARYGCQITILYVLGGLSPISNRPF